MKTTTNRSPTKATKPNPEPALVECPVCHGTGKIAPDAITFGMRLRAGRLHRKMTQDDLARELHVSRTQITNLEADRGVPSVRVLRAAADTLSMSIDYLLGRT